MAKYIDADLLRNEIERRIEQYWSDGDVDSVVVSSELEEVLDFLDSLQQGQPDVDLDADIEMEWDSFKKHLVEYNGESEEVVWLNYNSFKELAQLFFNLGLKAK